MPKLWTETIESHRRGVREAILDTTAALVAERGVLSVTMSGIAEQAGIGRATLYKYFPDVAAILSAWHERHVAAHLAHLAELRDRPGDTGERLEAVLHAYAVICQQRSRHGADELVGLLHRSEHVDRAHQQLRELLEGLLLDGTQTGDVRGDIAAGELADYCLHALAAAGRLTSSEAIGRLVAVTREGLRPPPPTG